MSLRKPQICLSLTGWKLIGNRARCRNIALNDFKEKERTQVRCLESAGYETVGRKGSLSKEASKKWTTGTLLEMTVRISLQ